MNETAEQIHQGLADWRSDFSVVASNGVGGRIRKRLEASPSGAFRVKFNGSVIYIGNDEALAITRYLGADPK